MATLSAVRVSADVQFESGGGLSLACGGVPCHRLGHRSDQIFRSSAEDQTLVGPVFVFLRHERCTPPTLNGMSFATAVLAADMSAKLGDE